MSQEHPDRSAVPADEVPGLEGENPGPVVDEGDAAQDGYSRRTCVCKLDTAVSPNILGGLHVLTANRSNHLCLTPFLFPISPGGNFLGLIVLDIRAATAMRRPRAKERKSNKVGSMKKPEGEKWKKAAAHKSFTCVVCRTCTYS